MPTQADLDANRFQYYASDYTTSTPEGDVQAIGYTPRYLTDLLGLRQLVYSGQASPWDVQNYNMQVEAARGIPMRDVSTLEARHDGENALFGGSPDLGAVMLSLAERIESGKASEQERSLFDKTYAMLADQTYRSVVPQASDAFNPLGDQFFGALGTIALGASGGLAGGALAGGGLGLGGTLAAGGTLAGTAGTGASVIGGALDEPILQKAGTALGALGAVAGGAGGLANLWGTGVQNLSDAARLASSAGRITGAVGSASGNEQLRQAGRYLGQAGQVGQVGSGVLPESVTDWSTQRGSEMDWDYWGSGDYPGDYSYWDSPEYQQFTSWDDPTGPGTSGGGSNGMDWISAILGGAGQAGRFLKENANWIGPAVGAAGGIAAGAIGSKAASDASGQQSAALNRAIDLQTAQWLQQQANQAPWLEAGQQALGNLRGLAGREGPEMPRMSAAINRRDYSMPNATPQWTPQSYQGPAAVNAGDYRWTPGQGPQAADYRYTPGQGPRAADYRYTPGQVADPALYQGAMPNTYVSTLTGQEVLDQDPGAAFRQSEARKALEASAAARGGLLSGGALTALQARSQDLASQEYGNAWDRMMARGTEQYGRDWNQYQQRWNQGVQGTQLELQAQTLREQIAQIASQQGWSQAQEESAFREQIAQIASQQGWSQAQEEAVFREKMAGQSRSQNFNNALAGQGQAWEQGMSGQQWEQKQRQLADETYYNRGMNQYKQIYGMDVAQNETDYQRQQQQYEQQLAQQALRWNRYSTLAGYGQTANTQSGTFGGAASTNLGNLYAKLGGAESEGTLGGANAWSNAMENINKGFQGWSTDEAYQRGRRSALAGLNA